MHLPPQVLFLHWQVRQYHLVRWHFMVILQRKTCQVGDHFFLRVAPVELFFDRNENAEVTGFTFVQRGQRIKVPKLR